MFLIIASVSLHFDNLEINLTDQETSKILSDYSVSNLERCHHCDSPKATDYFLCILGNRQFQEYSYLIGTIYREIPVYTFDSRLYVFCSERCLSEKIYDQQISGGIQKIMELSKEYEKYNSATNQNWLSLFGLSTETELSNRYDQEIMELSIRINKLSFVKNQHSSLL
jgi:hypothetical protein